MAARWAPPLPARSSSSVMTTSALWLMTTPAMPTPRSWTTRPQPPVGFLARALAVFADAGFRVERLMSDNHWSYTRSLALAELPEQRGIKHVFIRPLSLAERESGTVQPDPANQMSLPAALPKQSKIL